MYWCNGKGVLRCVGGSFIGGSTVYARSLEYREGAPLSNNFTLGDAYKLLMGRESQRV